MDLNDTAVADTLTIVSNTAVFPNSKWDRIMKSISYVPPTYFSGNRTLIDDKNNSVYQLDALISKAVLLPKKSTISVFPVHYNEIITILSQSILSLKCGPEVANGMRFKLYTYLPGSFIGNIRHSSKNLGAVKTIFGHPLTEKSTEYIFDFRYNSKSELLEPASSSSVLDPFPWWNKPPTHTSTYHA